MFSKINDALEANISTRSRLTPGSVQKIVAMTAAEAEKALWGHIYKQPGMPTLETCQDSLAKIGKTFGPNEVLVMLQRYGVDKLSDLWIGQYQSMVDFCNACLEYDYPPSGSWTNENKPTYPQDEL
jgi:hypothetical protein